MGARYSLAPGAASAFQDLPAEALAEADVYKSSSADLIEGGVAGTINLKLTRLRLRQADVRI